MNRLVAGGLLAGLGEAVPPEGRPLESEVTGRGGAEGKSVVSSSDDGVQCGRECRHLRGERERLWRWGGHRRGSGKGPENSSEAPWIERRRAFPQTPDTTRRHQDEQPFVFPFWPCPFVSFSQTTHSISRLQTKLKHLPFDDCGSLQSMHRGFFLRERPADRGKKCRTVTPS